MTAADIINRASELAAERDICGLEDFLAEIHHLIVSDEERYAYMRMIGTMMDLIEAA